MREYKLAIYRDAWVEIDEEALKNNYVQIASSLDKRVKICPVLKAQCYGLGGAKVAKLLSNLGAYMFAVATLDEAIEIRKQIPYKEILVLGYVSKKYYSIALEYDVTLSMFSKEGIISFEEECKRYNKIGKIHIKINTGMNRMGFSTEDETILFLEKYFSDSSLEITGMFSHFASADEDEKNRTILQAKRFDSFLSKLKKYVTVPMVHISASAAICNYPEYQYDMVRPGLSLTGHYASQYVNKDRIKLTPCITLKARLGSIIEVKKDEWIGYGFTKKLKKDTKVGLLPLGYSDGFTRVFSNNFYVVIRGKSCPIIGSICMDHCMIDLTAVPDAEIDDLIIVYGNGGDSAMTAEEVAQLRGTTVDEVLSNLSQRLPRKFV